MTIYQPISTRKEQPTCSDNPDADKAHRSKGARAIKREHAANIGMRFKDPDFGDLEWEIGDVYFDEERRCVMAQFQQWGDDAGLQNQHKQQVLSTKPIVYSKA